MKNVAGRKKIYSCNENLFLTDSAEAFYLAGFIAADGNIQIRKYSKLLRIVLSEKDIKHLEKIKKILNSNHNIKKAIVKASQLVNDKPSYNSVRLVIVSNKIVNSLQRFNIIPNKTYSYTFPEWLISHPLVHHFMRGYIDGDGSICSSIRNKYNTPQISLSLLGRKDFLKIFNQILITNCNINGSNILIKSNDTYRIRYAGNNQLKKIGHFLYNNSNTLFLTRKYDKIKLLLQNTDQMAL